MILPSLWYTGGTQPGNNTCHGLQKERITQSQKFWQPLFPGMLPCCPTLTMPVTLRRVCSLPFLYHLSYQTTQTSHVPSRHCSKTALTHQLQPGGASGAEVTCSLRVNKELFPPEANDNHHYCQSRSTFHHLILSTGNIQGIIFTCLK